MSCVLRNYTYQEHFAFKLLVFLMFYSAKRRFLCAYFVLILHKLVIFFKFSYAIVTIIAAEKQIYRNKCSARPLPKNFYPTLNLLGRQIKLLLNNISDFFHDSTKLLRCSQDKILYTFQGDLSVYFYCIVTISRTLKLFPSKLLLIFYLPFCQVNKAAHSILFLRNAFNNRDVRTKFTQQRSEDRINIFLGNCINLWVVMCATKRF